MYHKNNIQHYFSKNCHLHFIGSITFGDILNASPFNNPIDLIQMTGQTIKDVFEHSISKHSAGSLEYANGQFLQVSG